MALLLLVVTCPEETNVKTILAISLRKIEGELGREKVDTGGDLFRPLSHGKSAVACFYLYYFAYE